MEKKIKVSQVVAVVIPKAEIGGLLGLGGIHFIKCHCLYIN